MPEQDAFRISQVVKELGVGLDHIKDVLSKQGHNDINANSKIGVDAYHSLLKEFANDKFVVEQKRILQNNKAKEQEKAADLFTEPKAVDKPVKEVEPEKEVFIKDGNISKPVSKNTGAPEMIPNENPTVKTEGMQGPTVLGKIDLSAINLKTKPDKKTKAQKEEAKSDKKPVAKTAPKKETPAKKTVPKKTVNKDSGAKPKIVPQQQAKPTETTPVAPTEVAEEKKAPAEPKKEDFMATTYTKLDGPKILGKIELPTKHEPKKPENNNANSNSFADKKKRKRIKKPANGAPGTGTPVVSGVGRPLPQNVGPNKDRPRKQYPDNNRGKPSTTPATPKAEVTDEEIQRQIKETLARLSGAGKSAASKYRKEKRAGVRERMADEAEEAELQSKVLKVTEFVPANELAKMMDVPVNKIIGACMSIGLFISINQRLDAETIQMVAGEFNFTVEFVSAEEAVDVNAVEDAPEDLLFRAPIVTVMGHVDHGKTSLLDYIRSANVIAGEAGGITQHIGAYNVSLKNGKNITFLDTPGHEAFTAMRARGAKVTDIVIIVIAADDRIMPQTKEAINHAQAAGVPIIFAFNKMDKAGANAEKLKEELSAMNILVEDWGGKYQSQEISAKKGINIDELLEKVLLEAEMLDLKANPNKNAIGTVIESTLDKGKGYVARMLVQAGTMKVGDVVLAGSYSGRVKALTDERGHTIKQAGPSIPVEVLGLSGSPQAGDTFKVMNDEREAREIAVRRLQLLREQGYRSQKHITLDEIGRRLAIGDFKQLNLIIKGDVDGSVEALTDSLLKLSTERVAINVVTKAVGPVSESDVLLASASDAIIVAFNVRPSVNARKLAELEQIQIKTYSIIYAAIDEIKAAMEGMLAPQFEEKITANIQIREVFNITKVGNIAGCIVLDGKVDRKHKIRVIRDGIVVYTGELGSLKRLKDDVKEVTKGYECGLNIDKFNDIKVDDIIEAYEILEVKAKL
ncbi:MAG: translation initiation factor IF-2 [Bacteroidia bacterium]